MRDLKLAGLIAGTLLVVTACGGDGDEDGSAGDADGGLTALEAAVADCDADTGAFSLGDEGTSLVMDGVDDTAIRAQLKSLTAMACVLGSIDAPDTVIPLMTGTTALQGRQETTWDGYAASWTYHPDNGLDVIIETD